LGRFVGTDALAAFAAVSITAGFATRVFNFLVDGVSAKTGKSVGRRAWREVASRIRMSLGFALAAGAIATATLAALITPISVYVLELAPEVQAEAEGYWWLRAALVPLVLLNMALSGILQGFRHVRPAAAINTCQALLEMAGSAVVLRNNTHIAGRDGLFAMGVVTAVTEVLQAMAGIVYMLCRPPPEALPDYNLWEELWCRKPRGSDELCSVSGLRTPLLDAPSPTGRSGDDADDTPFRAMSTSHVEAYERPKRPGPSPAILVATPGAAPLRPSAAPASPPSAELLHHTDSMASTDYGQITPSGSEALPLHVRFSEAGIVKFESAPSAPVPGTANGRAQDVEATPSTVQDDLSPETPTIINGIAAGGAGGAGGGPPSGAALLPEDELEHEEETLLGFVSDGLNMFIRSMILQASFFAALMAASWLGTEALAAHSVINQLWVLISYAVDGWAAAGIVLGSRLAAQAHDEVAAPGAKRHLQRLVRRVAGAGLVAGIGAALVFGVWRDPIIGLFTHSPTVAAILRSTWPVLVISQPINGLVFVYDGLMLASQSFVFIRNYMVLGFVCVFCPLLAVEMERWQTLWGVWVANAAINTWRAAGAAYLIHHIFMKEFDMEMRSSRVSSRASVAAAV
jgi:Na+-driven multidrug efflux pump